MKMNPKGKESVSLDSPGGDYAFMTIHIINDKSKELFCNNHPILKNSMVRMEKLEEGKKLVVEQTHTNKNNEKYFGKVTVFNNFEETIWVKLNTIMPLKLGSTIEKSSNVNLFNSILCEFFTWNSLYL